MGAKDALVRGYAEALFAIAEAERALGDVEDELYAFAKAMEANAKLREALTNVALPVENKKAVVREVLGERANPVTANLIGFVLDVGRARELGRIAGELAEVAAVRRQHRLAEVRTAVPLSEAQRKKLAAALAKATGHDIEVKVVVDPSIVGGVVARVGDEVFDGSVARRLEHAKQQLGSV